MYSHVNFEVLSVSKGPPEEETNQDLRACSDGLELLRKWPVFHTPLEAEYKSLSVNGKPTQGRDITNLV